LKFYNTNTGEFLKDGYFENNTAVCNDKYPAFNFVTDYTSGNVEIYQMDSAKYTSKEIQESLLKTVSLSVGTDSLYYLEATADHVGLFRYKLVFSDNAYYSDPFWIISTPTRNTYTPMKSGILRFYSEDTLEVLKDGYLDENTHITVNRYLNNLFFDSELTISSISADIYELNRSKIDAKIVDESKIKAVTLSNQGSIIYLNSDSFLNEGLYRIKVTVTPTVGPDVDFYSELFCIAQFGDWVFETGSWDDLGYWWDNEIYDFS
jgi:hypothetical protein